MAMTGDEKANYERAAVALEKWRYDIADDVQAKAFNQAALILRSMGATSYFEVICIRAARLLRECAREGRPLP